MTQDTNYLIDLIINSIQDKKGRHITTADLSKIITAPTQCFVICEGNSPQQVGAIVNRIVEHVHKECGEKPTSVTGEKQSEWVVIDYGYVVAHVFLPDTRTFYDLENLYEDSILNTIPDEE